MAKDDKAKVRVFFGEIEGDNATIRDGLKSIAAAVNRTFSGELRIVRALKDGGIERAEQAIENGVVEEVLDPLDGGEPDQKPKSQRTRRVPSDKTVSDLDLMPEGKQSLKAFFESKNPKSQQEQFVVILFYLTHVIGVTGVNQNPHVHGIQRSGKCCSEYRKYGWQHIKSKRLGRCI